MARSGVKEVSMIMHRRCEAEQRMLKACVAETDQSPEEQQKRPRRHGPGHACVGVPGSTGASQRGVDSREIANDELQGGGSSQKRLTNGKQQSFLLAYTQQTYAQGD
jgi:hypothetical protein